PDGKYVLVSHNLGRFQVPTSQLQQGWMNTSAVSVVDARSLQFLGSVVLDEPERGSAGVWGLACDGDKLVVAQSGTHDVSVIDYQRFIDKFEKTADRSQLSYDLQFLYGMRKRVRLDGNGPRRVALSEGRLFVPTYFSDTLNVISLADGAVTSVAWNPSRMETAAQKGERYFNDAEYCFQNWQ
ncbi:MAG: YVTN family beta-propeller repeat-containing protein, partial [Rikenellaceae bacterium]|nr:YVTN family beta-propeller repeat-containing protein [Rikenellaceae bacterium]